MSHFGLPDESCIPYSATDHTKYGKHAKRCPAEGYCTNCMPVDDVDTCWAVTSPIRYGVDAYGQVPEAGEAAMMNEVLARGPITCSMATPEVFDYGEFGVQTLSPKILPYPRIAPVGCLVQPQSCAPSLAGDFPLLGGAPGEVSGCVRGSFGCAAQNHRRAVQSGTPPAALTPRACPGVCAGYHRGIVMDPGHNSTEIDHDVEVVGWGETADGVKFWEVRNSWGTFWGEMGFFRLSRGDNALQLEAGDCWYAVPTWEDEQDVRAGRKVGTMWGIMTPEEAAEIKPEAAAKPHRYDPDQARGAPKGGAATGVALGAGSQAAQEA
jgi:hypothetical protein